MAGEDTCATTACGQRHRPWCIPPIASICNANIRMRFTREDITINTRKGKRAIEVNMEQLAKLACMAPTNYAEFIADGMFMLVLRALLSNERGGPGAVGEGGRRGGGGTADLSEAVVVVHAALSSVFPPHNPHRHEVGIVHTRSVHPRPAELFLQRGPDNLLKKGHTCKTEIGRLDCLGL